jgi:hypothetical protein
MLSVTVGLKTLVVVVLHKEMRRGECEGRVERAALHSKIASEQLSSPCAESTKNVRFPNTAPRL